MFKEKLYILFFLLFVCSISVFSQPSGNLKGYVKDEVDKPVAGANVLLKEYNRGTTTNGTGYFEIKLPSDKDVVVEISFLGYETYIETVKLSPNQHKLVEVKLKQDIKYIGEVTVTSQYERQGTLDRININKLDKLPGASSGIEAVLGTLGASLRSEFSSQYSVRGGSYDENLVYINDIEVYKPLLVKAGQQEGLSIINSDLVSSIQFSAGGFEAQYGDKMSSVLDIKYFRPSKSAGSVSISMLGASLHFEGASKNKKLTFIAGSRYKSNQYLLKTLETKGDYKPSFFDFQSYITYDVSKSIEIGFLGMISQNQYSLKPQMRETVFGTYNEALMFTVFYDGQEVDRFNTFFGAFTVDFHPSKKISLKFIASAFNSFETIKYDISGQYWLNKVDTRANSETLGDSILNVGVGTYLKHARNFLDAHVVSFTHKGFLFTGSSFLRWGINYQAEMFKDKIGEWEMIDSAGYSIPYSSQEILLNSSLKSKNEIFSNRITGFLQNTFEFEGKYVMNYLIAGIRGLYYSLNNQFIVSPRIIYTIKPYWDINVDFHLAIGWYFQPPFYKEMRSPEGVIYKDIKAQKSIHYVFGSNYKFLAWKRPFVFSSEIYFKYMPNIIAYKVEDVDIQYLPQYKARGYATGIEFKINGEFVKDAESWATLSLMQVREDIYKDYYINDDETVEQPGYYSRPTDQLFNFGLYFQDYFPRYPEYKVHLTFLYASELPYGTPDYSRPSLNYYMKPYSRVDIGLSKSIKNMLFFKHTSDSWIHFEIFNLFGIQNEASLEWIKTVNDDEGFSGIFAVPNFLSGRLFNVKITSKF